MLAALIGLGLAQTPDFASSRSPVSDTFLSRENPDLNYGRSLALEGGPDRVILIRHTALDLVVPQGHRITSAKLVLTMLSGGAKVKSVHRVIRPWGEGPGRPSQTVPEEPARFAATWKEALAGESGGRWDGGGADGSDDKTSISGWSASLSEFSLTIDGLGGALQAMLQDPASDWGLRIEMDSKAAVVSSENMVFGPIFQIETAPEAASGPDLAVMELAPGLTTIADYPEEGAQIRWRLRVKNVGSSASTAAQAKFSVKGAQDSEQPIPALATGEETTVSFTARWRSDHTDHRAAKVSASIIEQAGKGRNNSITVFADGLAVARSPRSTATDADLRRAVDRVNHHILPFSRFSFAMEGITERVRYVSDPAAAHFLVSASGHESLAREIVALASGFGHEGDTRDDGFYTPEVSLTDRSWPPRLANQPPMPESHLATKAQAGILQQMLGKLSEARNPRKAALPSFVFLRLFDPGGKKITKAQAEFYQGAEGDVSGQRLGAEEAVSGALTFSPSTLGRESLIAGPNLQFSDAWLNIKFSSGGAEAVYSIPWARLVAESARSRDGSSAFMEARVMLPSGPVDFSRVLSDNATVEDASGRFPAQLLSLVDQDKDGARTSLAIPAGEGYWLDLDIGRDRLVGAVVLEFESEPWDSLEIHTYQTGQTPAVARLWMKEINSKSRVQKVGDIWRLTYIGQATQARFIRIEPGGDKAVKLTSVKVHPARVGG
jgi:hypothetical protein